LLGYARILHEYTNNQTISYVRRRFQCLLEKGSLYHAFRLASSHLFWRVMRAHVPSTRAKAMAIPDILSSTLSGPASLRSLFKFAPGEFVSVASTTAKDGGSAEHAGANILPRITHQPFVSILPTRAICGLVSLLLIQNLAYAYVPLDRIIAVVNEDVIMQSELESKIRTVRSQIEQQGARLPPPSILERQVLDNLIQNRIQLQLAARAGIRVDDEKLNRTISNIAAENQVSLTQFREILEQDGYKYEQFREDIRNEITLTQLRKRQVENRIVVTEKEIDNFLANQEFQGTFQAEVRLSHILLSLPENATSDEIEQVRQVATQIREDLLAGTDFTETASAVSDGGNAKNGGDLGWRKLEDVPSLFVDYIPDMKNGDISELIQSPSGFHIIKITGVKSDEQNIVEQTHARHILIRPDQLTTVEQARNKLAQLKQRIESGDDFGLLAKGNSDDSVSAIEGGDLGWQSPGDLVPEFQRMMDTLEPGQISDPFRTNFGWHICQVLERRNIDNTESVKRGKARAAIRTRKLNEAMQNWARRLRDEAYVEYRLDDI